MSYELLVIGYWLLDIGYFSSWLIVRYPHLTSHITSYTLPLNPSNDKEQMTNILPFFFE